MAALAATQLWFCAHWSQGGRTLLLWVLMTTRMWLHWGWPAWASAGDLPALPLLDSSCLLLKETVKVDQKSRPSQRREARKGGREDVKICLYFLDVLLPPSSYNWYNNKHMLKISSRIEGLGVTNPVGTQMQPAPEVLQLKVSVSPDHTSQPCMFTLELLVPSL